MALDDDRKLTERDLLNVERAADEAVKALPEGPEKDAYVDAFAAAKHMTAVFMSYNRALLKRIGRMLCVIAGVVVLVALGGGLVTFLQAQRNHRETVMQVQQDRREQVAAAARAKQTIQASRLQSTIASCQRSNMRHARAVKDGRTIAGVLITPPLQDSFNRLIEDIAPYHANCRAYAERAIRLPLT